MIGNVVACAAGAVIVLSFLGFMLRWVPATPLIVIVVIVMALMLYDFYSTLRYGEDGKGR